MKKLLIRTGTGEAFNAASKARLDAEVIARRMGYEPVLFAGGRTANQSLIGSVLLAFIGLKNWFSLIRRAEKGSLILLQYPHYPMKSAYLLCRIIPYARKKKNLRMIALVHDLDSVRGLHGNGAFYSDHHLLPLFDRIICHNEKMKEYLIGQGIPPEKLIPLGIFDYLTQAGEIHPGKKDGIAIAGNLSPEKCGYVQELIRRSDGSFSVHLYGKGLEKENLPDSVSLHGAFPPEELPGKLCGGFGLVWDGQEIRTCTGKTGEYLRINDPHKCSLYLSSGMPVIVWEQAAIADFVRNHEVGIPVDSLDTLSEILQGVSEEQYGRMCRQAEKIGRTVREGAWLAQALKKAEEAFV